MKKTIIVLNGLLASLPLFAATPVDLSKESPFFLKNQGFSANNVNISEQTRSTDMNNTLHVRVQQTYKGYPILGSDAVIHIPEAGKSQKPYASLLTAKTFMNGNMFLELDKDLKEAPQSIFSKEALQKAVNDAAHKTSRPISDKKANLVIFIDENQVAHWAYEISFMIEASTDNPPEKPTWIVDAVDGQVYEQWNDLKTRENIKAGGFGGNHKTGKKIFDGAQDHEMSLIMRRDPEEKTCFMENASMHVKSHKTKKIVNFSCEETNPEFNDVYWNGDFDKIYTTWSPSNDVLFGAMITEKMFWDWYNMPMLINRDGTPMFLPLVVHNPMTNAYWDSYKAVFGNSENSRDFNPFTQLDTVGHEICHGFTEHHSGLNYYSQSGGLNEAFSDMCGIAAEFYAFGKTTFLVGYGDVKPEGKALRYMDMPSRDCEGDKPGNYCSIDHMSQYHKNLDVHYSSGIFNRVYYTLANSEGWDPKMAFDVMVKANVDYWTSNASFDKAACGVMMATKDYQKQDVKYDLKSVADAFNLVGINVNEVCDA